VTDRILRGAIANELSVAARYAREVSGRRLRAAGVDPAEYGFLSLVGSLQPVTRTTLAREAGLRRTTLRDALRPLIERGHVVESPHPTDRRATLLTLTPAGQEIFTRGIPVFREFLASLDQELEGKLDELERAVWTVRVALERLAAD
jgi:MarR family transcriptional regulator, transcriptional regulator for hemolysin